MLAKPLSQKFILEAIGIIIAWCPVVDLVIFEESGKLNPQIEELIKKFINLEYREDAVFFLRKVGESSGDQLRVRDLLVGNLFEKLLPPAEKAEEETPVKKCVPCGKLLATDEGVQDDNENWRCEIYCIK